MPVLRQVLRERQMYIWIVQGEQHFAVRPSQNQDQLRKAQPKHGTGRNQIV
jgi:hypothetical protein